jgi:hypothetical protein
MIETKEKWNRKKIRAEAEIVPPLLRQKCNTEKVKNGRWTSAFRAE